MSDSAACGKCGFLCVRNTKDWSLDEVDLEYRNTGILNNYQKQWSSDQPHCFLLALDLQKLCRETPGWSEGKLLRHQVRADIFAKERKCPSYFEWQQGSTPKEHRDMKNA